MNKTDATEILQKYVFDDEECIAQDMKDYNEALKMAIEALQTDGIGRYENAMQKLREMPRYLNNVKVKQIKKISTNTVQGEWIDREHCQVDEDAYEIATCSHCKAEITLEYPNDNFCPNCGARMKASKEE